MELRALRAGEEEELLALLDGWDVGDGWRGRDFFRRYLELDPTYRPENVQVAADAGRLVSCVQIFPRQVRLRGRAVPAGGIGSVFTAEDRRREGIGGRVLTRGDASAPGTGLPTPSGHWPGLGPGELHVQPGSEQERDLKSTTDFRDVFGEAADRFLGISPSAVRDVVLRGYTPNYPGLFDSGGGGGGGGSAVFDVKPATRLDVSR